MRQRFSPVRSFFLTLVLTLGLSVTAPAPSYAFLDDFSLGDFDFSETFNIVNESLTEIADWAGGGSLGELTTGLQNFVGGAVESLTDTVNNLTNIVNASDPIQAFRDAGGLSSFTGTADQIRAAAATVTEGYKAIQSGNIGSLATSFLGDTALTGVARDAMTLLKDSNITYDTRTGKLSGAFNLGGILSDDVKKFLGKSNISIGTDGKVKGNFDVAGLLNNLGLSDVTKAVLGTTGGISYDTSTGKVTYKNLFGGLLSGSLGGGQNSISVNLGALLGGTAGLTGSYSGGAIASVLCHVVKMFTGSIGAGIATLAIIVIGLGGLMGKFSPPAAIITCVGIAIIFGAPAIVKQLTGVAGCFNPNQLQIVGNNWSITAP